MFLSGRIADKIKGGVVMKINTNAYDIVIRYFTVDYRIIKHDKK